MTEKESSLLWTCWHNTYVVVWDRNWVNYILYFEHMTVFESLYGWVPSKDGADTCFKTESFQRHITKCAWTPPDAQHYSMLNSVMYLKYVIQFLFLSGIVTHSYAPKRIYIGNQGPWSCSILSAKIERLNSGEFLDPISWGVSSIVQWSTRNQCM